MDLSPYLPLIAPFATHHWKSRRSRSHWTELEGWQDSLTGPISSVIKNGGCGYVYERVDEYFSKVTDPDSLRRQLLEWHSGLLAGVDEFVPATREECDDLAYMRMIVGKMLLLIEDAYKVESERLASEQGRRTRRST